MTTNTQKETKEECQTREEVKRQESESEESYYHTTSNLTDVSNYSDIFSNYLFTSNYTVHLNILNLSCSNNTDNTRSVRKYIVSLYYMVLRGLTDGCRLEPKRDRKVIQREGVAA